MLPRVLMIAGWALPFAVLLLFAVKGQFYNPAVFIPPVSELNALPVPVSMGGWLLEEANVLPADRMYEKINGKSDYYLQYGAVELSSGEWVAGGQRWDMYLYRFDTEQGARGAYNGEKPGDGLPVEGVEGYALPGQAAMTAGNYYMQLNALVAGADPAPAIELCMALVPYMEGSADRGGVDALVDLTALAGADLASDAEGFVPENAFGFSALNQVRTVDVSVENTSAVWFAAEGDAATVSAFAEELATYGGEELFSVDGVSGGSMFGSWSIAGVVDGVVWGVQNAPSREALMNHWTTLRQRLGKESRGHE